MKSKINEGLLTVEAHGSLQLRMVRSVSFGCLPFSVPKRKHFTAELGGFDCSLFSWNDWLQVIYTFSKGNVFCVWLTAIYLIACNDRLCDEDIHMDLQSLWCAILVGGILHSHHCRTKMNGSIHSSVMALRGNQRTSGSWRQNTVHKHSYTQNMYVYAISSTWLEDEFRSFLWDIAAVQGHGLWNGSKSGSFVRGALSDKDNTGAHCGSYQPIGGQIILDHWWPQRTEGMP